MNFAVVLTVFKKNYELSSIVVGKILGVEHGFVFKLGTPTIQDILSGVVYLVDSTRLTTLSILIIETFQ